LATLQGELSGLGWDAIKELHDSLVEKRKQLTRSETEQGAQ